MKRFIVGGATALSILTTPAFASNNLMFIMDASNSMWGQLGGVAKIEIAKDALGNLLGDLPSDTEVGLMAYGHRNKDDCADVEVLAQLGSSEISDVVTGIRSLTPRGKTPIAATLEASASTFNGVEGPKSVVLISDGIETCNGDPCAAAEALADAGIGVRVHVVGFDLSAAEREQIECIAERGKGRYFDASSVDDFADAIQEAVEETRLAEEPFVQLAQVETVTDASPVRELLFTEDFEGFDLSENWTVLNPNPENFIVEDGSLLAISSTNSRMNKETAQNVFLNDFELPRGDWDIEFTLLAELQTGRDLIEVGLYRDNMNYLNARFWTSFGSPCSTAKFGIAKVSNGEQTQFDYEAGGCSATAAHANEIIPSVFEQGGVKIILSKRGRSYSATLDGAFIFSAEEGPWAPVTDTLTSLRVPGQIAFSVAKFDNRDGEVLMMMEKIEVYSVE